MWLLIVINIVKKIYISVYETLKYHLKIFHVLRCSISPASINHKCQVQSFISRTDVFAKGCIWPVPASSKMSQFTSLSLPRRKDFLFIRKLRLFPARIFRLTLKKLPAPFYPTTQTRNLPINIFSQNVQMRNLRFDPLIIIWKTSAWVQASPWSFLWGFLSILQVRFQSLNSNKRELFLEYRNDKKSIAWLLFKPGKRGCEAFLVVDQTISAYCCFWWMVTFWRIRLSLIHRSSYNSSTLSVLKLTTFRTTCIFYVMKGYKKVTWCLYLQLFFTTLKEIGKKWKLLHLKLKALPTI